MVFWWMVILHNTIIIDIEKVYTGVKNSIFILTKYFFIMPTFSTTDQTSSDFTPQTIALNMQNYFGKEVNLA